MSLLLVAYLVSVVAIFRPLARRLTEYYASTMHGAEQLETIDWAIITLLSFLGSVLWPAVLVGAGLVRLVKSVAR